MAKQSIERLVSVLDLYKLDVGSYPTTEQGLGALVQRPSGMAAWNGPYLRGDTNPADPWGRAYVYRVPSTRAGKEVDLCSRGPDGDATGDKLICNQ